MKLTHSMGAALLLTAASTTSALAATAVNNFGSNPGELSMYMHAPSNPDANPGLVVSFHGCTQNATTNEKHTGWSTLADEYGFYVVYPQQSAMNNTYSCFNWAGEMGDHSELQRGLDENGSVRQMIQYMVDTYGVDESKIYVTGFSAGAAMANVMLATYPDLFAGGAPMAGVPYRCSVDDQGDASHSQTVTNSYNCMGVQEGGVTPLPGCSGEDAGEACMPARLMQTPTEWKRRFALGYPGYEGKLPKVIIWHGSKDEIVSDKNLVEQMEQWTAAHGVDQTSDLTDPIAASKPSHNYKQYQDQNGNTVVATVEIIGLEHGISADPGTGEDQGGEGSSWESYFYDTGIYSSYYSAKFWGLLDDTPPPPGKPTVAITNPLNGATVKGNVTVAATATDQEGIDRVEFFRNGQLHTSDTSSPYQVNWDTTAEAEGDVVTWKAVAYDVDGQAPAEDTVSVTVRNEVVSTPPSVEITSPTDGATVTQNLTVSADATDDVQVTKVVFNIAGTEIEDSSAPYSVTVDLSAFSDGSTIAISATAHDNEELTSADAVTVTLKKGTKPVEQCESETAFNYYHETAGRATSEVSGGFCWFEGFCWGGTTTYKAVGSGDDLGASAWIQTTVHTTGDGVYHEGTCP